MYEIELDYHYEHIDENAEFFAELPEDVQQDLIEWVNHTPLGTKDKEDLFNLYKHNKFVAWNCPECDERVFKGDPENWDNFQGSRNQDFSYFGNRDKFTEEYINAMCDNCRCSR